MKRIENDQTLEELQHWYQSQCDGEWEHEYGILVDTLDNPGWSVSIDVSKLVNEEFERIIVSDERSEGDWIFCKVKDRKFTAASDPTKLEKILEVFYSGQKKCRYNMGRKTKNLGSGLRFCGFLATEVECREYG